MRTALSMQGHEAALLRLAALSPLALATLATLAGAVAQSQPYRIRRELLSEGREIEAPRLLVRGWAARVRQLPDGRRQFLNLLVPGDLIGLSDVPRALATATVIAVTDVQLAPTPDAAGLPDLAIAYAIAQAMDQAQLLAQIVRLGRFNAQERIADLLLELHERLTLNGLARGNTFDVPLTQEVVADALGLTSVHVNRMVQQARRDGDLQWKGGRVTLTDPAGLALKIGRQPLRVHA